MPLDPRAIDGVLSRLLALPGRRGRQAELVGRFALATRAPGAYELLARGAGFDSYDDALSAARTGSIGRRSATWLRELGRVSHQQVEQDFAAVSAAFYDAARRRTPDIEFRATDSITYIEAILLSRGPEAAQLELQRHADLHPIERACLAADIAGDATGSALARIEALNAGVFEPDGLTPVALREGTGVPFDRLAGTAEPGTADGPRVTVIMTTFRRNSEIMLAVESILRQTWRNLELIIVDDHSGPEYMPALTKIAETDQRIRVLPMPTNGGAYKARNAALAMASGDYVTFQDDDDWSHPERIERQVLPLVDDPQLCMSLSLSVRAVETMSFRYRAHPAHRINASSSMYPMAVVREVGPYDSVRKAADSEYIDRVMALTGRPRHVVRSVLAIVRLSGSSLSRADFSVGWSHPSREEYREAYEHYHAERVRGEAPGTAAHGERPFPAPRRLLGTSAAPTGLDLVVASDWRVHETGSDFAVEFVRAGLEAGLTVGVLRLSDARRLSPGRTPLNREVRSLINAGKVTAVLPDDPCVVDRLVVADAALLEVAVDQVWAATFDHASAVVLDEPTEVSTTSTWSTRDVTACASRIFGVDRLSLLVASSGLRHALEAISDDVIAIDLRPLAAGASAEDHPRLAGPEPRLGRWVGPAEVSESIAISHSGVFPPADVDVRMYALAGALSREVRAWPATWLTYGPRDIGFHEFLKQLDYFVAHGGDVQDPGLLVASIRAAAAGCIVIADPALEGELGAAATYAEPHEVAAEVQRLHADPAARTERRRRAYAWCASVRQGRGNVLDGLPVAAAEQSKPRPHDPR